MLSQPDIFTVSYGPFGIPQGISELSQVTIDDRQLLLSAGSYGTGVFLHQINGNGRATFLDNRVYSGQINPFSQAEMAIYQIGAETHVYGVMAGQSRIWQSSVTSTGLPGGSVSLTSIGGDAPVDPTGIAILGNSLVLSQDSGALLLYAINPNGSLTLRDSQSAPFSHVTQIAATTVGSAQIVVAVSATENTLASYVITGTGRLRLRDTAGAQDGLGLGAPNVVELVELEGRTFALVGAAQSSSLTVLEVNASGTFTPRDHVTDTLASRFGQVASMEVVAQDDRVFVIVGGPDDGISVLALTPDGTLVHLTSFADTQTTRFDNVLALAAHASADRLTIFGSSESEAGVTSLVYDLSSYGGVIMPSADGIARGASTDDILVSGAGSNTLTGRGGADLFVLKPDSGSVDVVSDYRPGIDQLDLSNIPFLYDISQLTVVSNSTGARIVFGTFEAQINSYNGQSLDADDLTFGSPISHHFTANAPEPDYDGTVVTGTTQRDRLSGTDRDDLIRALEGNDVVMASAGADVIDGGEGFDTLSFARLTGKVLVDFGTDTSNASYAGSYEYGHAAGAVYESFERIIGGKSNDQLRGSSEDDVISGGAGVDRIYGRGGDDRIIGGAGIDVLCGNAGADIMTGGNGDVMDRFIFFSANDSGVGGKNRDVITDFTPGQDRIELNRIDADMTQPQNQAFTFVGASAFSGTAGELRYHGTGSVTIIRADIDGDRRTDFEIRLNGSMVLSESDFFL
ncbi:MAG: M10 family metallopeptidase C-terminal domain-containing protein [Rhodobacteraceae bacterium]|nr:M10 family metallopeptidase C-terminal domain-containing protein [Paracoccaceae bacterium]